MAIVPDVSAILGQALDDEDATFAESVIAAIARDKAVVPTLFWSEIRNVLVMAERRKRIAPTRTTAFLTDLALLPFSVDDLPREASVLDLARKRSTKVRRVVIRGVAPCPGMSNIRWRSREPITYAEIAKVSNRDRQIVCCR